MFDWEKMIVWFCMLTFSFGVWYIALRSLWKLFNIF